MWSLGLIVLLFFSHKLMAMSCAVVLQKSFVPKRLQAGSFEKSRTIHDYFEFFPSLQETFIMYGARDHWVDLGAGEGMAILTYYTSVGSMKVTGVGYDSVPNFIPTLQMHIGHHYKDKNFPAEYKSGRLFEDIPNSEFREKADIVTDLFGVHSYTTDLGGSLKKTLDLMAEDGLFFLNTDAPTIIVKPNKERVFLHEVLSQVKGLEVEVERTYPGGHPRALRILKTADYDPRTMPELILKEYREGAPPSREFIYHPPESLN